MSTTKAEPKPKAVQREHTVHGVSYPIVRTYYDVKQDLVIDVYKKTKTVDTKKGIREVDLFKHTLCTDADLQKKYRIGTKKQIEVNVDVD